MPRVLEGRSGWKGTIPEFAIRSVGCGRLQWGTTGRQCWAKAKEDVGSTGTFARRGFQDNLEVPNGFGLMDLCRHNIGEHALFWCRRFLLLFQSEEHGESFRCRIGIFHETGEIGLIVTVTIGWRWERQQLSWRNIQLLFDFGETFFDLFTFLLKGVEAVGSSR